LTKTPREPSRGVFFIQQKGPDVALSTDANDSHAVTQAGYERLCEELRWLATTRRDEVAERRRDARSDGADPADNAGLADAIEEQHRLERRIDELETMLARARIASPAPDGTAGVGSRVRVRPFRGKSVDYELVGALEADARHRRVSIASPVGRALVGHTVGDIVEVDAPGGVRRLEIISIARMDGL